MEGSEDGSDSEHGDFAKIDKIEGSNIQISQIYQYQQERADKVDTCLPSLRG